MGAFDTDIEIEVDELLVAASQPTEAAAGATGTWRTDRPVVDHGTCIDCGLCFSYCPDGVIDREVAIDLEYCKGCGICAEVCPVEAIEMVAERTL